MRTNVTRGAGAGATGHAPVSTPEASPGDPIAPESAPNVAKPPVGAWAEDWSAPAQQRQMSALWPLVWLTVPLLLLVFYGLFGGE